MHPIEALFADPPEDELPQDPPAELPRAASGAAAGRAVASAMKDAFEADIMEALAQSIANGETLQSFAERLRELTIRKGWLADLTEDRKAWRARVIYETNLRMHYQAENWRQLTAPDMKAFYPYWRYVHGELRTPMRPRPEHVAWDGLVLSADDDFWRQHFPPNGWGCTCGVRVVSRGDLARMGKDGPDKAPAWGTSKYTDPRTGETRDVPHGIDPGFDATPQEWIERLGLQAKAARQKAFEEAEKARAKTTIEVRP